MTAPAIAPWKCWLWRVAGARLFRCTPHIAHGARRRMLRFFGATMAPRTKIRRSVSIDQPWNLTAGELTIFGDEAILRCAEPVVIGARCVISQYAIVSTEARDLSQRGYPRASAPISIEDDVWVATDSLVMPGTTIREGVVVGARSYVDGDLPPWSICVGHPAQPRGTRELNAAGSAS